MQSTIHGVSWATATSSFSVFFVPREIAYSLAVTHFPSPTLAALGNARTREPISVTGTQRTWESIHGLQLHV